MRAARVEGKKGQLNAAGGIAEPFVFLVRFLSSLLSWSSVLVVRKNQLVRNKLRRKERVYFWKAGSGEACKTEEGLSERSRLA